MKRVVLAGVFLVTGALLVLIPLFGAPGPGSVLAHPEWARLLLRGIDLLSDEPGINDTAEQAFATLSGRESRSFAADQYVAAKRVEIERQGKLRRLRPVDGIGEAAYAVSVARAGEYRIRFNVAAPAPAEAELTRAGKDDVLQRFSIPAGRELGWVDAGSAYLAPGAYHATVLLPEGASLQHVEVAPPCVHPIEPRDGWKKTAVTTTADVAITVLQATDLESELPPAGEVIVIPGSNVQLESGSAAAGSSGEGFHAGRRSARVLVVVDVPASGLYTLSALGTAPGGQRWLADGCQTYFVCPSTEAAPRWRTVLSASLQRGRHVLSAALSPDTSIVRLKLEPKKQGDEDYVGAVARLGLDLGPAGPITRQKADDAWKWVQRRRGDADQECTALTQTGQLVAEMAAGASSGSGAGGGGETGGDTGGEGGGDTASGPAAPTAPSGPNAGGGPVPPPILPPMPPASPTVPTAFQGF